MPGHINDRRRRALGLGACVIAAFALAACSEKAEPRIDGERLPLHAQDAAGEGPTVAETRPTPPPRPLTDWTQLNGDATHALFDGAGHVEAPAALRQVWRASAGASFSDTLPPGQPIVVGGRIFARDGESGVTALDARTGKEIWSVDLTMEGEDPDSGFGGGLAASDGRIYATTGFGEVSALDPATGAEIWRQRFGAPIRVAPTAAGGRVFIVTRDNVSYGLDGATGETLWRIDGAATRYGNLAGAPPATLRSVVAIPFGSGELALARAASGLRLWNVNLSTGRGGVGLSAFSDITSAPVIVGTDIYAGNAGGRLAAIDGRVGRIKWARAWGALSPVWAAGDSIFVATTEPALARLDAATGRTLWRAPLTAFEDPEDRQGPIDYRGPVLAGGRLLSVASDGRLLAHDPVTGELIETIDLPGAGRVAPVVVDGGVYVLTDEGELIAFR